MTHEKDDSEEGHDHGERSTVPISGKIMRDFPGTATEHNYPDDEVDNLRHNRLLFLHCVLLVVVLKRSFALLLISVHHIVMI